MIRIVPLADYTSISRPSVQWLIPEVLPKPGLCLLIGEPFCGKSFLALQLALRLAQGGPFLHKRCARSRVLYLQFDTSETVWRDRLNSLRQAGVDLSGEVYMVHPDDNRHNVHILMPEHQQFLRECLQASNPDVVIIDVLREIHSADEQDSTAMKCVGDALMSIFQGLTLVVIHHTRKLDREKPIEVISSARGSSYITGKADTTWLLDRNTLHIVSRFSAPQVYTAERLPCGLWRL